MSETFSIESSFDNYFNHIGKPFSDIMRAIGVGGEIQKIEKHYFDVSRKYSDQLELYPGISELLNNLHLRNIDIGILTSKNRENAQYFISKFNLKISSLYCPMTGYRGKPYTDLFQLAAKNWGCKPSDIVYIGDMEVDRIAAIEFGAAYIHVNWGYGEPKVADCQRATSPSELHAMLIQWDKYGQYKTKLDNC